VPGQKSFKKKGMGSGSSSADPGNPTVDFMGKERTNETHYPTSAAFLLTTASEFLLN